jgi:hypothetical protein
MGGQTWRVCWKGATRPKQVGRRTRLAHNIPAFSIETLDALRPNPLIRANQCSSTSSEGIVFPALAIAEAYMGLGDQEQTFDWLHGAIEQKD